MSIDDVFSRLVESRKEVTKKQIELDRVTNAYHKLKNELKTEYAAEHAIYKVGDVVRLITAPKGRKYTITEIDCAWCDLVYPLTSASKIIIRYHIDGSSKKSKFSDVKIVDEDMLIKDA